MKSTLFIFILIGAFVVSGCNNNYNMMGNSRYRNHYRNANNRSSIYTLSLVYCNGINNECINKISTSLTQTQQEIEILKCSSSFNSCILMGGVAATSNNNNRMW
jgi:hypothetical protein